ncbi:MAG: hypothetical protein IJ172_13025 [Ruminococcus sp.]|nr:hypothetical protein [Ruminococcus sp.]
MSIHNDVRSHRKLFGIATPMRLMMFSSGMTIAPAQRPTSAAECGRR